MVLLRRFLVVAALMFWQGGFTFYAAVVVPAGQAVLGSHLQQGMITRVVTHFLNLAGAVCLLPLAWDGLRSDDPEIWRRRLRWAAWWGMTVTLAILFGLHNQLDQLLDPAAGMILDYQPFRSGHRVYLWISTIQWGFGLLYCMLALQAWRAEDRGRTSPRIG